ncbi:hypothetical protein [Nitrospira moscoviensis]|uniref:Uncharacterized protein n=1 Tax=Nitrospira moscoviensis TaxID=42253 RepID=A0A0K2GA50_NITMO|nr:hypothetical protein [Nitrospira moscoviensis]ALA57846.1 hypothetical protein NITMOv2_1419 [Nitrospira moscoviensis]
MGTDPGDEVTEAWWDEMLVQRFDVPEEEKPVDEERDKAPDSDPSFTTKSKA